jgi:hypothetical protein
MPLVACPKCATTLKIPDGSVGNVKCPKCNALFAVGVKPAPAFEVVDATPAPAPRPAAPPAPPSKPASKPIPLEPDFEVVEEPRPKKKVTAVADDDYDDDDDRPRGRRRRDDDDDDDDDRPRRKKKRRRDYDDYEDNWRPSGSRAAYGAAKVGMLLVSISLWMYLGTLALLAFFLLIAWVGASIPNGLMIVTGLIGLATWVVGLIGLGFCIAGPSRSRGLAIAATAVAAVHVVMAFVVANNSKSVNPFTATIGLVSFVSKADRAKNLFDRMQKETDPAKLRSLQKELEDMSDSAPQLRGGSEMRWADLATLMPFADALIAELSYDSKGFSDYVLGLLSGLVEVARLILLILLVGSVGYASKDYDVGGRSVVATIIAGAGVVAAMVILVIGRVIVEESTPSKPSSSGKISLGPANWLIAAEVVVYLIHIGSLVLPAILAMQASSAAARRR